MQCKKYIFKIEIKKEISLKKERCNWELRAMCKEKKRRKEVQEKDNNISRGTSECHKFCEEAISQFSCSGWYKKLSSWWREDKKYMSWEIRALQPYSYSC